MRSARPTVFVASASVTRIDLDAGLLLEVLDDGSGVGLVDAGVEDDWFRASRGRTQVTKERKEKKRKTRKRQSEDSAVASVIFRFSLSRFSLLLSRRRHRRLRRRRRAGILLPRAEIFLHGLLRLAADALLLDLVGRFLFGGGATSFADLALALDRSWP